MKEKNIKRDFTWYKLSVVILLFEVLLFGFTVTYKLYLLGFIMLLGAWGFSALFGLVLCMKPLAFKSWLPLIFFLLSFSPCISFVNMDMVDFMTKMPDGIFMALLFMPPASILLGWISLYLFSRRTKPQTSLNRASLFVIILLVLSIPATITAQKIVNNRVEKDVVKSKNQAQQIIEKLEEYHSQHAIYPKKLEDIQIGRDLIYLPWFDFEFRYSRYSDSDSYSLEFDIPTGFLNYWIFDPMTKNWRLSSVL